MKALFRVSVLLLIGSWALGDQVDPQTYAEIPQELFAPTACWGAAGSTGFVAKTQQVDSVQLAPAQAANGKPDPAHVLVKANLNGQLVLEILAQVTQFHYDPNFNGDPIMKFQVSGLDQNGNMTRLFCSAAH